MTEKLKKTLNGNGHLIGWITLALMMIAQIVLVSMWAGRFEQKIYNLESSQSRLEAGQNRIEQKVDQHLLQSAK